MTWFKNMKISRKLIASSVFVAIITAIVCALGLGSILSIKNSDSELYGFNTKSLEYVGSAATELQQLRYDMLKLTTLSSGADRDKYTAEVNTLRGVVKDFLAKSDKTIVSADLQTSLDSINKAWESYSKDIDQYFSMYKTGDIQGANTYVTQTLAPIGIDVRDQFLKMFQHVSEEAAGKAASNVKVAQLAIILMVSVGAASIVMSVVLGLYVSRLIGRPLARMVDAADKLAVGNVDVVINDQGKDEVGMLAAAFSKVIDSIKEQALAARHVSDGDLTTDVRIRSDDDLLGKSLSDLVSKLHTLAETIITASDQVSTGANMVSGSSMALSQGATEQASAVQELSASITQIAAQTNQNAQNADKANELAKDARSQASLGNDQMNDMLRAMEDISLSSRNIGKIIKVIDDIAFQTNILALNAAVEAARAGQQGKGFAVVAEEVRSLAAKSASAAKETTALIEESIRKAENGTKIAGNTAEALRRIVTQVELAADFVGAITVSSREQAAGIDQINSGLSQISQVVQTTAATSEESAAASEELSGQAAQLKETVGVFKIRKYSSGAYAGRASGGPGAPDGTRLAAGIVRPSKPQKVNIALTDGDFGKY